MEKKSAVIMDTIRSAARQAYRFSSGAVRAARFTKLPGANYDEVVNAARFTIWAAEKAVGLCNEATTGAHVLALRGLYGPPLETAGATTRRRARRMTEAHTASAAITAAAHAVASASVITAAAALAHECVRQRRAERRRQLDERRRQLDRERKSSRKRSREREKRLHELTE
jgi:hypothetical protein